MADATEQDANPYQYPTEYGVEVFQNKSGTITIQQENPHDTDPSLVVISPEKVDLVIRWLQAVRDQVLADRAAAEDQMESE